MSLAVTVTDLEQQKGAFHLGPVSLSVKPGSRTAIVGPSGSGKTSLLRCIAGLERPDRGAIRIGERAVAGAGVHVEPVDRGVGLVFQDGALWPHLTAVQHLTFAAPKLSRADALQLLERAGLAAQADKKPGRMSGGEAQRLGLLRALAQHPQVLLLDEPLRSVDVHQRDGLVLLVRTLCDERDVTSILVTHDRDEALALADELAVMRDGQLVEQGAAVTLLEQPRTAFTAAFLRGAACLQTSALGGGRVRTPFGEFDAPAAAPAANELRLVLFPGDAEAHDGVDGPEARILARLPGEHGMRWRCAVDDQIVVAKAPANPTHHNGTTRLRLTGSPRLLPWQAR
ncbi:MAG: ATP-binding cassette domain-containing protein [Planctomycetes bacterium]|nr:ATP-binding cassette domain-containing protein [Planctomycetota bacterium]